MAKSYTRENRPKGVSKKEWDKARKAEGRDPYAKFFSDPVADRKRQEAARRTETPREVSTPQSSSNLTPEAKSQADQFISRLQGMQPSTLGGAVQKSQMSISEPQKRQADEFISKLRGMAPASPFQEKADQIVKQQQAQPKSSIFKDIARGLVKQGANVLDLVNQRQAARFMDRKLNAPSDLGKFKVLGEEVQTPISKLNEAQRNGTKLSNRQAAGLFGETALDVASLAPAGKLASIFKSGAKSVAKETAKEGLKEAFKSGVKYGATYTPAYGVAGRLQQDKGLGESLKETPKEALVGGIGGGLVGVAGYGAGKAFGMLGKKPAKEAAENAVEKKTISQIVKGKPKVETPIQIPKGKTVYRGTLGTGEIENILKGNTTYIEGQQGGLWAKTSDEAMNYAKGHSAALGSMTRTPKGEGAFLLEGKMDKNGLTIPIKAKNIKTGEIIDLLNSESPSPIQGGIVPPKTPPTPITETAPELPKKQRGFIETVKASNKPMAETAKNVDSRYDVAFNEETIAKANQSIADDFEGAVYRARTETKATKEIQAESMRLIDELQAKGRTEDALDILEKLSERATEAGQANQILAAYNRLTPEGIWLSAQRQIKKAREINPTKFGNLKLTAEQGDAFKKMAADVQAMAPGEAKDMATREMLDELARLVPTPWAKKVTTLWKAGLLTGVKGAVGGNTAGNTTMAILKKVADVPASGIDQALALATGQRSKVFTLKGLAGGFMEGLKTGLSNLRKGIGADDLSRKLDYTKTYFGKGKAGVAAQKYTDTVFNVYSALDRPYYHSALKNSLYDLAEVEAKNKGLKGKAMKDFVDDLVKEPTDDLLANATAEAERQVFQQKNAVGSALSGAKQGLKKYGGSAGELVSEGVAPFTGVPSAIASAVHHYGPTGAVSGVYKALSAAKNGTFNQAAQRELSEALGKGMTGTGIMWLGSELTKTGQMTLGYPTDPGERALWEAEGKTPYSIQVFGKWKSLNYMGPIMSLLAIGGEIQTADGTGLESIGKGALGSGKAILSSSPLQGMQAGMNAVTDPQRYGDSYVRNLVASGVPTLISHIAAAGDTTKREVNSIGDAISNRTPGLKDNLLPKRDVLGQEIPSGNTPAGEILDPFRSSKIRTTPVVSEFRRLQDAGYGPTLSKLDAKLKINGKDVELTPEKLDELEAMAGQSAGKNAEKLIVSETYKKLTDEQKQDAINLVVKNARDEAKNKLLGAEIKTKTPDDIENSLKYKLTYEEIDALFAKGKSAEAYARINRLQGDEKKAFSQIRGDEKPVWYNQKEVDENPMRETFDTVKNLQLDGKDDEANKLVSKLSDADYKKYVSLRSAWRAQNMVTLREKLKDDAKDARVFYESLPQKEKQRLVNALKQSEYNTLKGK